MPLFRCQPSSDAPGVCPPKGGRNESSKSSKSKPFPMIGSIYVSSQHPSFCCFLVLCQLPPATRSRMRSLPKGPALKALEANFHGFFHREKLKLRKKNTQKYRNFSDAFSKTSEPVQGHKLSCHLRLWPRVL